MAKQIDSKVILERLNNLIKTNGKDHKTIIDQVTKTNGTVCVHDTRLDKIENWKSKISGALIVLNIIVVPVLLYLVYTYFAR